MKRIKYLGLFLASLNLYGGTEDLTSFCHNLKNNEDYKALISLNSFDVPIAHRTGLKNFYSIYPLFKSKLVDFQENSEILLRGSIKAYYWRRSVLAAEGKETSCEQQETSIGGVQFNAIVCPPSEKVAENVTDELAKLQVNIENNLKVYQCRWFIGLELKRKIITLNANRNSNFDWDDELEFLIPGNQSLRDKISSSQESVESLKKFSELYEQARLEVLKGANHDKDLVQAGYMINQICSSESGDESGNANCNPDRLALINEFIGSKVRITLPTSEDSLREVLSAEDRKFMEKKFFSPRANYIHALTKVEFDRYRYISYLLGINLEHLRSSKEYLKPDVADKLEKYLEEASAIDNEKLN